MARHESPRTISSRRYPRASSNSVGPVEAARSENRISYSGLSFKCPIALIDTRAEVPGKIIGTLHGTYTTTKAAFAANEVFQRASGGGEYIRTKIVTLKDLKKPLDPGQPVCPAHLAGNTEPEP